MTMNTIVRRIRASEGELLRFLRLSALRDSPHAFRTRAAEEEAKPAGEYAATAARHADSDVSTSFVAFAGDDAVGLIGAFFEGGDPKRPFICALWVAPSARSFGVGTSLVNTAAEWLRARGATSVLAWVADANRGAKRFYASRGFIATAERQSLPSNATEWESLLELKQ